MARATWSGTISFGIVTVPIKMYVAVDDNRVRLNQLSPAGNRVRQKRVDEVTQKEVAYDQIQSGFEVSKGRYVLITEQEIEAIAPKRTKSIELSEFVSESEINPLAYVKPYYLQPAEGGGKAYALLAEAMQAAGKVGIGRFVLKTKEYLAAIAPRDNVLVLYTLAWADEVRKAETPPHADVSDAEKAVAVQLVEALSKPFDHASHQDVFRTQLLEMIESKAAGEPMPESDVAETAPPAGDLLTALEASLEKVRQEEPEPAVA